MSYPLMQAICDWGSVSMYAVFVQTQRTYFSAFRHRLTANDADFFGFSEMDDILSIV